MARTDPSFAEEIKKYGAPDFSACFSCGNCTAICGLTDGDSSFPRMMIRYGMLGLKDEILSSKEPWLCYSCGECSETCPRQANPGQYMAALRKYAIASSEPTGLTKLMFKSSIAYVFVTLLLAAVLGFFLLTTKPENEVSRWLFNWLPYEVIHNLGLLVFVITGLSMVTGFLKMFFRFRKSSEKKKENSGAISETVKEITTFGRYETCNKEEDDFWKLHSFFTRPRFIHISVMWGFIGLLVATTLDFLFKDPATDIWWPSRLLGTAAGVSMVYGAGMAIIYRVRKITAGYSGTTLADWIFLWFLLIAGITGFWMEISVAVSANNILDQVIFLIHTIISMELVLLFAFSKFAHALYRPLALYFYFRGRKNS